MLQPVYIVSGFPRSGTSMMMRCLEAGGIPCVYNPAGDVNRNRNTLLASYIPNPHGFYEDAPLHLPDWSAFHGKAVKVVHDNLHMIPPDERLRIVYMRRDPAEIASSYRGIRSGLHSGLLAWLDRYVETVAADVAGLVRSGHETTILDYAAVIADPITQLTRISWPLDVVHAATVVDPLLYRHRGSA